MLAQKKIVEAKIIELEVVTSIETSKLKTNLVNLNKEVEKLMEEKHKLEEELAGAKDKAIKEYKSSEQLVEDLAEESLGVFSQGFEYCKKKVKEPLSNVNTSLLVLSLGAPEKIKATMINDPNEEATGSRLPMFLRPLLKLWPLLRCQRIMQKLKWRLQLIEH